MVKPNKYLRGKKLNNNKPRQKQTVIWIDHYDQSRMFSRCPPLLPGLALSFLAFSLPQRQKGHTYKTNLAVQFLRIFLDIIGDTA